MDKLIDTFREMEKLMELEPDPIKRLQHMQELRYLLQQLEQMQVRKTA